MYSSSVRVQSPMFAFPPLSPERAAAISPSGSRRVGPGTGAGTTGSAGAGIPAVTGLCGIGVVVPSGSVTRCSTSEAGTRVGQYTPKALSAEGGVVVWKPG